jgi:hypothetical protein
MRAFILALALPLILIGGFSGCAYDEAMRAESSYQRSYIRQLDEASDRRQELELEQRRLESKSLDLLRSQQ